MFLVGRWQINFRKILPAIGARTMTISQSLQAFGILLEILGLALAYVKFGSADELWFKKMQPEISALHLDPEKEVFDFRV